MKKRLFSLALAAVLAAALAAPASASFTDVAADAWYADAVAYCEHEGLMDGMGDGRFAPDGAVTRAQAVTVLWRLAGAPETEGATVFSDVAANAWYADPVRWAYVAGVANGSGGRFAPDDAVTREQLAAFFFRFSGGTAEAGESFADEASISAWALDAARWAKASGLMSGVGGGRFDPAGGATRAQLAQTLMNYCENVVAAPELTNELDVMCAPTGIARTSDGALLVTDGYNRVIWRVQDGAGTVFAGAMSVTDIYGQPVGGYNDDAPNKSLFASPWAVAPYLDGWAVSDPDNGVVRLVTSKAVKTLNAVKLTRPTGLAAGADGSLYIADTDAGVIYRVAADGKSSTVASNLIEPMGLCWHDGALYCAETGAHRIIRLVSGRTEAVAGSGDSGFRNGRAETASFSWPQGVAVGPDGTVYVADTANGAIRRIRGGTVDTLLAQKEGRALTLCPVSPVGLLVDGGKLYVCDSFARTLFSIPLDK